MIDDSGKSPIKSWDIDHGEEQISRRESAGLGLGGHGASSGPHRRISSALSALAKIAEKPLYGEQSGGCDGGAGAMTEIKAAGSIAETPIAEMRRVFDRQRAASRREPKPTLDQRLDALGRLRGVVLDNKGEIARAVSQDFGTRSRDETQLLEIVPVLNAIRYARTHLAG